MRGLRRQEGFTLPELLVILFIAGVVLAGVASVMRVVLNQSTGVMTRTDASQRGRLVMDRMTQQLRSQVCVDPGATNTSGTLIEKPSLAYASPNQVTFYVDLGSGKTQGLERRELIYEPANRRIQQKVYKATSALGIVPTTFAATATETTLLSNVSAPSPGPFKFYAYDDSKNPATTTRELSGNPLADADRASAARIEITMDVAPGNARITNVVTRLQDSVHLRTADPNVTTNPDPDCR